MNRRYYIFAILAAVLLISAGYLRAGANPFFRVIVSNDIKLAEQQRSQEKKAALEQRARQAVLGFKAEAVNSNAEIGFPIDELMPELVGSTTPNQMTTTASSALVIDEATGKVLYSKNSDQRHSIASITKLFTALVFLDFNPGWDKVYQLKKQDRREGGKVYVWTGEKISVKDLFHLSLVASGNTETLALVNSTGLGEELFVKKMNEKAQQLGLKSTVFEDPIGLDEGNISTAEEIARFAKLALSKPEISKAVTMSKWKFSTVAGRKAVVSSTDELLGDRLQCNAKVVGGKTGYNNRAGYCFVGKFNNPDENTVISVVLGETSKQTRFSETEKLIGWAYDNYQWQ